MDNDLMARRLRPPSEPTQAAPSPGPYVLPEYVEQEAPSFQAWPPAPPTVEVAFQPPAADLDVPAEVESSEPSEGMQYESAASSESALMDQPVAEAPAVYDTPPWSTEARDEVPWDRPSDFEQPTDTASPDQPSWDRPAPQLRADSDLSDGPAADIFGTVPQADADLPFWLDSAAGQRAAVASTPRFEEAPALAATAADPDDAHAPVLGDIAMPASRRWPEMTGHDAGHNEVTLVAEATAQAVEPAQTHVEARGGWDDSLASFPSWSDPQHSPNGLTPTPAQDEWVMAAGEPTELGASTPDSAPDEAAGPYADANPDFEAPDAEPVTALSPLPDAASDAESAPAVATEQMALAPSQPLILRIERAITDDSRLVVGAADAAWRVNDVNAVVLEVGRSDTASEAATPRNPAFEPRGTNGGEYADPADANTDDGPMPAESTWLEPTLLGPSADHSFPAATLDPPPWLDPTALAGPEPAPWDPPADLDVSAALDSFELASVPPASTLPPPWAQAPLPAEATLPPRATLPARAHWPPDEFAPPALQAETDPLGGVWGTPKSSASATPQFAAPGLFSRANIAAPRLEVAQSAFAPPLYIERQLTQPAPLETATSAQAPTVAQEQSDLWFLATESAAGDSATADEASVAKESSWTMPLVTIGFAILVVLLFLVFIQLMTSFLR